MCAIEIDFQRLTNEWQPQFEELAGVGSIYDPRKWENLWPGAPAVWILKFLLSAAVVSADSTCLNRHTGATLVEITKRRMGILTPIARSSSFNGAPTSIDSCAALECCNYKRIALEDFCKKYQLDKDCKELPENLKKEFKDFKRGFLNFCLAIHGEERAIYSSPVSPQGKMIFSTTSPCPKCARMMVEMGIAAVIYLSPYRAGSPEKPHLEKETEYTFKRARLPCVHIPFDVNYVEWLKPHIESAGIGIKDINDV